MRASTPTGLDWRSAHRTCLVFDQSILANGARWCYVMTENADMLAWKYRWANHQYCFSIR